VVIQEKSFDMNFEPYERVAFFLQEAYDIHNARFRG